MKNLPHLDADVLIIGAGLSGLSAAIDLQQSGVSCLVLEARDRVGGKTWSQSPLDDGSFVDVGAAWINDTTQSEVFALARDMGLELVVQNVDGWIVQEDVDGTVSGFEYGGTPERLSYSGAVEEMVRIRGMFEEACQGVKLGDIRASDPQLDGMTMYDWVVAQGGKETAIASARVWTRAMLGLELEDVSALFFLAYCKAGGGLLKMRTDHRDGGQYLRFVKGTQGMAIGLARRLGEERVVLNAPVRGIAQVERDGVEGVVVEVSTDANRYICRRVIVTLPTTLYNSIRFSPPLPQIKQHLATGNKQGYTNKVILIYDSPWWRTPDTSPKDTPRPAKLCGLLQSWRGPITVTRDTSTDSPYSYASAQRAKSSTLARPPQYSLTCFLVGTPALSLRTPAARLAAVKEHLSRTFGVFHKTVPEPIAVAEHEWASDQWSMGCPCPAMGPGTMRMVEDVGGTGKAWGNVHFAGTEMATVWRGYMEGAIRSGRQTANEVVHLLGSDNAAASIGKARL